MSKTFPKSGVKVSFLTGEFVKILSEYENLQGLTTYQVCEDIIKPITFDDQSSYCDVLMQQNHWAYGAKAQAFISHAHSYQFLDLINALQWLLRDEPEMIVWIDLVSINQHQLDWTYEWLSTTFKSGRTIMVMSPWHNPLPNTRSWCVFEAYCTAVSKGRFQIALSKKDEEEFLVAMKSDVEDEMDKFLGTISAERSQSSAESDKSSIFEVIRKSIGFLELDKMLFKSYHDWIIQVTLDALNASEDALERAQLQNAISRLYYIQGKYDKAEGYAKQCMDYYVAVFNEDHPDRLSMINNYARLLGGIGRFEEAQELNRSNLEILVHRYGEDDPKTFWALHNLAWVSNQQGKHELAREQFERCLRMRETALDTDHPDTLVTKCCLGEVLINQGEYEMARDLFSSTYEKQKSILGYLHRDTMITLNGLARALICLGSDEKAVAHHELCWSRQKAALGEDQKDSLRTMNYLASTLYKQGKVEESIRLYRLCVEKQAKVLGDDHYYTILTKNKLEGILESIQDGLEEVSSEDISL